MLVQASGINLSAARSGNNVNVSFPNPDWIKLPRLLQDEFEHRQLDPAELSAR